MELITAHKWHFYSLDLCYMGRLLDDAAGGPGGTVLPLRQVGQGHGGIDLLPVRLIFALRLLLVFGSDATADDTQTWAMKETKTVSGERLRCGQCSRCR